VAPQSLSGDPFHILLGHNAWAFRTLLEHCRKLPPEAFHQDFGIGPGSLHDNITHCLAVMGRWIDRIDGRPLRPRIDGRAGGDDATPVRRRTIDELLAILDAAAREWTEILPRLRAQASEVREVTFPDGGPFRFSVAAIIIHVTNHGMHHRAQCMNMLKRAGHPINADLDELEWQVAGEP
jgi:uncharacterized damage-inducible protein DinB